MIRRSPVLPGHWEQRRERLGGALWVVPASMVVAALIAGSALSLVHVDDDSLLGPLLFKGSHEEARRLLLTVATSIVGILALVIGLSMVAIQMATNRYSPRLLRNYLRDRPVQFVLGVFVGAFTYNTAGLYTVGVDTADYPRLAVTAGLASLFVSIGALIYYLDHMVHSIQIDSVLARIGSTTVRAIALEPPGIGAHCVPAADLPLAPADAVLVGAQRYGYIQTIRPDRLLPVAAAADVTIEILVPIGGHTLAGAPIAAVWPNSLEALPDLDALEKACDTAIHIGFERTMRQDVAVGLEQIVDIALLSMHNFDFHTAVQATNELTILLDRLATNSLGPALWRDGRGTARVVVPGRTFDDYLDIAIGQIRRRGAAEPVVLRAVLTMLRELGTVVTDPDQRASIARQVSSVLETAHHAISDTGDVQRVQADANTTLRRIGV